VDISGLENFEQGIYVSSLDLGRSVTILTAAEELIVRVNPPRVVEAAIGEAGVSEEAVGGGPPETVAGQGQQTQDKSDTEASA
jgi:hypothetical protein